jgi:uncharacterized membrane protein
MDFYSIFKFLHVVAAMAWVGGGLTLLAMVIFAERAKDDAEMMRILGGLGHMGMRWFLPTSALTLLFGLVMTFLGNMWTDAWILIGLAGLACSFLIGHFVLRVRGMEAGRLMGEGKLNEGAAVGRRMLAIAKFDYVILLTVVAAMVLKPSWTDFVTLGLLATALVAGAGVFLGQLARPAPQAA